MFIHVFDLLNLVDFCVFPGKQEVIACCIYLACTTTAASRLVYNVCVPPYSHCVQLDRRADLFRPVQSVCGVCRSHWMWTELWQPGLGLPGIPTLAQQHHSSLFLTIHWQLTHFVIRIVSGDTDDTEQCPFSYINLDPPYLWTSQVVSWVNLRCS